MVERDDAGSALGKVPSKRSHLKSLVYPARTRRRRLWCGASGKREIGRERGEGKGVHSLRLDTTRARCRRRVLGCSRGRVCGLPCWKMLPRKGCKCTGYLPGFGKRIRDAFDAKR